MVVISSANHVNGYDMAPAQGIFITIELLWSGALPRKQAGVLGIYGETLRETSARLVVVDPLR